MRMRLSLLLSGVLLLLGSACSSSQSEPTYRPTATIKDLMDSVVDPNSDYLWNSVSTESTAQGIVERAPKTDEEWRNERRHAIALLEASNLLQIPGRLVAQPNEKSENPQIEESPEVIKTLIDSDRAKWNQYAAALYDATTTMMKPIAAKDAAGILEAGERLEMACENCHKHYWYPNEDEYIRKVKAAKPSAAPGTATPRKSGE